MSSTVWFSVLAVLLVLFILWVRKESTLESRLEEELDVDYKSSYRSFSDDAVLQWFDRKDDGAVSEVDAHVDVFKLRQDAFEIKKLLYHSNYLHFEHSIAAVLEEPSESPESALPEESTTYILRKCDAPPIKCPLAISLSPKLLSEQSSLWKRLLFHIKSNGTRLLVLPPGNYEIPDMSKRKNVLFNKFLDTAIYKSPILARRQKLHQLLTSYAAKLGCDFNSLQLYPQMYDCQSDFSKSNQLYVKPFVPPFCYDDHCVPKSFPLHEAFLNRPCNDVMLQETIKSPLLIHSKQFKIHTLVFVKNLNQIYFNRGFVKLEDEQVWDMQRFNRYLSTFGICDDCTEMWNAVVRICTFVVEAFLDVFVQSNEDILQYQVFELVFVVNAGLVPYFNHGSPRSHLNMEMLVEEMEILCNGTLPSSWWHPIINRPCGSSPVPYRPCDIKPKQKIDRKEMSSTESTRDTPQIVYDLKARRSPKLALLLERKTTYIEMDQF